MLSHRSLLGLLLCRSPAIFIVRFPLAARILGDTKNRQGADELVITPGLEIRVPVSTTNQAIEAVHHNPPIVVGQRNRLFLVPGRRTRSHLDQMRWQWLDQFAEHILVAEA